MLNNRRSSKPGQQELSPVLKRARKSVYKQALLAGLLIVLTVVVLFAMTVAWYTNIVQTSGLVFEASVWGFDGNVTLSAAGISAAPGDEGIIELTAESKSSELTAVSLNVSKENMDEEIQKRIYFYVDVSKVRNGETMERVYLGNQDSYTYLLFSNQTLMLTETVRNDAPLKWHWVYDVLGYYVQGTFATTVTTVTDEDGNETEGFASTMEITEYLRPIEYEFDEAKTTFDEDGQLLTIDGTQSVYQFLYLLSLEDGYPGEMDGSDYVVTDDGEIYYAVAVDENTGSGVWAYLCTYDEIQTNTAYDTWLGEQAAQGQAGSYTASLTISAQNSRVETLTASTPGGLVDQIEAALASGEKAVIQLTDSITLSEPLVIGGTETDEESGETVSLSQQVMLDLNGYSLTIESGAYSTNGAAIQVAAGSGLTVTDGTLVCDEESYAIDGAGAEITLSNVKITDVKRALNVRDNADSNTACCDAIIRLVGCEIETTDVSILISGNGTDSTQKTQLIVEDTSIESEYIGIAFNGSTDQWGTSTQIIHSEIYGYWAGIYHPQSDAEMVISQGSEISGYTGLVLKGGSTSVLDSTIQGIGEEKIPESLPMSGFNDTGDGIYIESNYGWEILLEISGSSIVTSEDAQALRIYPDSDKVNVTIYSGSFSTDVEAYCAENSEYSGLDDTGYYIVKEIETVAVAAEVEDDETGTEEVTEQTDEASLEGELTETETGAEEEQTEETQTEETQTEEQGDASQSEEPESETETGTEEEQTEETQTEETQTEEQGDASQSEEPESETETGTEEEQTEETQTEETQTEEQGDASQTESTESTDETEAGDTQTESETE